MMTKINKLGSSQGYYVFCWFCVVATLTLGLRSREGLARLRAKREAQDSPHMLLGVQGV
jgi:hypothetical protein